jgi:hypothetical protein
MMNYLLFHLFDLQGMSRRSSVLAPCGSSRCDGEFFNAFEAHRFLSSRDRGGSIFWLAAFTSAFANLFRRVRMSSKVPPRNERANV